MEYEVFYNDEVIESIESDIGILIGDFVHTDREGCLQISSREFIKRKITNEYSCYEFKIYCRLVCE